LRLLSLVPLSLSLLVRRGRGQMGRSELGTWIRCVCGGVVGQIFAERGKEGLAGLDFCFRSSHLEFFDLL
jgi:hypothetical protein